MKGGKREGAGRPPALDPVTKYISVKLTEAEYRAWVALGASKWLRPILQANYQPPPTS
jgi:hypothetical protein